MAGAIEMPDSVDGPGKQERWALKYHFCRKCGRNDIKHLARGLCSKCYEKEQAERHVGHRPENQTMSERLTELAPKRAIDLEEFLRYEYTNKKRSMIDIANDLGCTRQAVYKMLRRFDIGARSQSEAANLAIRRGKKTAVRVDESGQETFQVLQKIDVNEKFFSSWSAPMAWVLGLVFTDGNIDPGSKIDPSRRSGASPRLKISQKDPEILYKAVRLMECNAKLRYSEERRYGSTVAGALYTMDIANSRLYHDLVALGLTPNKSLTMPFPNIPQEFCRHFVRGCWDGDGTVHISTVRGSTNTYASIVSGSLDFMKGMVDQLFRVGIMRRKGIHFMGSYRHPGEPLGLTEQRGSYRVTAKGRENLTNLFHYLYDGVDSSIRLERKRWDEGRPRWDEGRPLNHKIVLTSRTLC
jgi:hypothetical protein